MMKFEQLRAEDQVVLALEMLRTMFDGKRSTIKELARANGQTVHELWRDVCDKVGLIECEPWDGFPAGPKKEIFESASGVSRPLSDYIGKLLQKM